MLPSRSPSLDHLKIDALPHVHLTDLHPFNRNLAARSFHRQNSSLDAVKAPGETETFLRMKIEDPPAGIGEVPIRARHSARKRTLREILSFIVTPALLRSICYMLHAALIGIHLTLLGLWAHRLDHRVTIPVSRSNVVSVGLTVTLQTFFTIFQAALVFVTQQLALRRNLLQHQKLTAIHDESGAWSGLGAAVMSLWGQIVVPAAVWNVISVTLYLICIAILHVSSSSLLNLQSYNATFETTTQTTLGMPNFTNIFQPSNDWSSSTAVASVVGQLSELSTLGVANATVYDTLVDTTGIGNATVNATTFGVDCYSLPNLTAIMNSDNISFSITSNGDGGSVYFETVYPLYQNVLQYFPMLSDAPTLGRQIALLGMPAILDSQGNPGSTVLYQRPIEQANANGTLMNETVPIQAISCSLSLTYQTGIVDAQTNRLLEVDPSPAKEQSQWTQWQWPPADTPTNDSIDWFFLAFEESTATNTPLSMDSDSCKSACFLTMLEVRLMNLLGLYTNAGVANQSTVSSPPVTLSDLENALGNVAAAMVWTGARVNSSTIFSGTQFTVATGEATITKSFQQFRLNINVLPLAFGIGASTILLALAIFLTREADDFKQNAAVDSAGILEVIWLSTRQPEVQDRISEVQQASGDALRKAGMFNISFGRAATVDTT